MSEGDSSRRDFRSSYYYKSLHLAKSSGEKNHNQLEGLLKMEIIGIKFSYRKKTYYFFIYLEDLDKLRLYCLSHTLPMYCRALVWKILLGKTISHITNACSCATVCRCVASLHTQGDQCIHHGSASSAILRPQTRTAGYGEVIISRQHAQGTGAGDKPIYLSLFPIQYQSNVNTPSPGGRESSSYIQEELH